MRFSFKRIRARAGRRETLKTDEQGKVVICRAVRYGTVQYSTVQYSTVQYRGRKSRREEQYRGREG